MRYANLIPGKNTKLRGLVTRLLKEIRKERNHLKSIFDKDKQNFKLSKEQKKDKFKGYVEGKNKIRKLKLILEEISKIIKEVEVNKIDYILSEFVNSQLCQKICFCFYINENQLNIVLIKAFNKWQIISCQNKNKYKNYFGLFLLAAYLEADYEKEFDLKYLNEILTRTWAS